MINKTFMVSMVLACKACVALGSGVWTSEQRSAVRFGAAAKFDIAVVDDAGNAVSNALVSVGFGQRDNARLGEVVSAKTDENGHVDIEGRTTGNNLWIKVEKEGCYSSKTNFNYIAVNTRHDVRSNRWQPYGEKHTIVLRERRNPVICKKHKGAGDYVVPSPNKWYGFDLEKGDWVVPFGMGERIDVKVRASGDGKPSWESRYIAMEMEFVGKHDGFYLDLINPLSEFRYSYCANVEKLFAEKTIFTSREWVNGYWIEKTPFNGRSMVARIRTEVNDEGEVVSCKYANIRFVLIEAGADDGPVFTIDYRLNPNPNDSNLETL